MTDQRIAIIGAGVAGLTAARTLRAAGRSPRVLDKGRSIGGRLASRQTREGPAFDHGAQYVTARLDGFAQELSLAAATGTAAVWETAKGRARYVGMPAMNSLAGHFAGDAEVELGVEVTSLRAGPDGWTVATTEGEEAFETVLLAVPAPQAVRLLGDHPLVERLRQVEMAPCLTLMAAFEPGPPAPFTSREDRTADLAWVAHDGGKPGREAAATFVAHAGEDWSRAHLEADKDEIARLMLPLLCDAIGRPDEEARLLRGHRWRYARVTAPLGAPCIADHSGTLLLGGDWCLGARVEAAWQSGIALAERVLDPET